MTRWVNGYHGTLRYLYGLQYRGIKYGLRNIRQLLAECGHPERRFVSLHIAGTNGKGSTSSCLASILQEAGYRTGLYTSPHLVRFSERIRINGCEIPVDRLVRYVREMRRTFERAGATFFEATTCIAFRYFADEAIEAAVIETGLGGRLDATNVVRPVVSVITNVAMDHTEYLGSTLRAIAKEKAGIIKKGIPVVTASTSHEVLEVLREKARRTKSPFHHVWEVVDVRTKGSRRGCAVIELSDSGWKIPFLVLGHPGVHQVSNAALAVAALRLARDGGAFDCVNGTAIARGLRNVVKNTGLAGRMQTLEFQGVEITLDVAHNADGMRTLADAISSQGRQFPLAVFGIVREKDAGAVLDELRRVVREVIAVAPRTERARDGGEIARLATERGILAVDGGSVRRGLTIAFRRLLSEFPSPGQRLLVVGSHYLVGETLEWLKTKADHKNA